MHHCPHRLHLTALLLAGATAPLAAQSPGPDVDSLLATLTTRQKAAQLVMPWIAGSYLAFDDPGFRRILRWVDSMEVGGVIVSIGSPGDIAAKLNHLQQQAPLPLLVASDLEGGTAFRFTGGTGFPSNMGVGASGREDDAYQMGRIIAQEGRAVGVHITFSPVADVNNNPNNPIINTRSFGGDPALVARLVAAQVRGTQEHGMLATAKHFPGHGDTETDSHLSLPVVSADWARIDSLELVPFRAAIDAGVALVMSAHVAMPGIDGGRTRPATMAPEILTGILRDSLGFEGLIVTDALDMGGVTSRYGPADAAVQALLAGSDLLLQPREVGATIDAVERAVAQGRVPLERLDRSARRVLEMKARLGLFQRRTVDLDQVGNLVGSQEALRTAGAVSARSLVLLKDSAGVIDRLAGGPRRISLVTYGEANAASLGGVLAGALRRQGHTTTLYRLYSTSGPASFDSAQAVLARSDVRLLAVSVRAREGKGNVAMPRPLAALIDRASADGPAMLISLGSPYLITQTPSVAGYLLAWISNPLTETAVAQALAGAEISGTLPVTIPPTYRIGAGLRRGGSP